MRIAISAIPLLLLVALAAPGCATMASDPTTRLVNPDVVTRVEPNGDVVSEYRVAGQLRVVKVIPARGPSYYLMDSDRPRDDRSPVSPVYWKLFEWD